MLRSSLRRWTVEIVVEADVVQVVTDAVDCPRSSNYHDCPRMHETTNYPLLPTMGLPELHETMDCRT